jgi:hypothetical protein
MASAKKNQNNQVVSIEGLEEGVRQQIAIGFIKIDYWFQPRIVQTDVAHVEDIKAQYRLGFDTPPALILFLIQGIYHLVDGFHRYKALVDLRFEDKRDQSYTQPWCVVFEGTREQAMEMAMRMNLRNQGKKLEIADRRQGLMRLFDNPAWRNKTTASIKNILKISSSKIVEECRIKWHEQNNEPLPSMRKTKDGKLQPAKRRGRRSLALPRISKGTNGDLSAKVDGKKLTLGNDPELASVKLCDTIDLIRATRERYESGGRIDTVFVSRGIASDSILPPGKTASHPGIWGRHIGSAIAFTWESFRDKSNVTAAAYRALWCRDRIGTARTVVLCPVEDGPAEIMDHARTLGVEWMTIEQFAAEFGTPESDDTN